MKEHMTMGKKYGPAMEIHYQEDADRYFEKCVQHSMEFGGKTRHEAEARERENLAYFAGYYDSNTRERVERLFKCSHPVFGAIKNGEPTPQEAFNLGFSRGRKAKDK